MVNVMTNEVPPQGSQPAFDGQAVKARLQPIGTDETAVEIIIGVALKPKVENEFNLYRLKTASPVTQEFRKAINDQLDDVAKHSGEEFVLGSRPNHDLTMTMTSQDFMAFGYAKLLEDLFQDYPSSKVSKPKLKGNTGKYDPHKGEKVLFYCSMVEYKEGVAAYLTRVPRGLHLSKYGYVRGLIDRNQVTGLKDEPLAFSTKTDVIIAPPTLYILDVDAFRNLFPLVGAPTPPVGGIATVTSMIAAVNSIVTIDDLQGFEEGCRGEKMRLKLTQVAAKTKLGHPLDLRKMEPQIIEAIVKKHSPLLDNLWDEVARKFVHDKDHRKQRLILQILDDDYVQSEAMAQTYEADSKRPI